MDGDSKRLGCSLKAGSTMKNPSIVCYDDGFAIEFVRQNGKVLIWVQDLSGRKMKSVLVNLPAVVFPSSQSAVTELRQVVIPYLLREKDIKAVEILGWD